MIFIYLQSHTNTHTQKKHKKKNQKHQQHNRKEEKQRERSFSYFPLQILRFLELSTQIWPIKVTKHALFWFSRFIL